MAGLGIKRKLEFVDISSISEEVQSATVHVGHVSDLSPLKTSRKNDKVKYFDCKLTDGKVFCRLVSFEPKIRSDLVQLMDKGQSISIMNCDIKKSKMGAGYELILSEKSLISPSPKIFKVTDDFLELEKKKLDVLEKNDMIDNISVRSRVSIKRKVISLEETETIKAANGNLFTKRECIFSDRSKASRLVLWENLTDLLQTNKCYTIRSVYVKTYNGQKYFSSTDDSVIQEIADLGEVSLIESNSEDEIIGEIVGVLSNNSFHSCISCASKVEQFQDSDVIGRCSKCGLRQRISRCKLKLVAQVMIEDDKGIKKVVTMFGGVITELIKSDIEDNCDLEMKLLTLATVMFKIRHDNIVPSVKNIDN
jgi:hypothetical protein